MSLAIASLDQKNPELERCKQQSARVGIERLSEVTNDVNSKIGEEHLIIQDVLEFYLKPK